MEKTRQEEIEKVHDERHDNHIDTLRCEIFKRNVIVKATNTYTNLSLFANDYDNAHDLGFMKKHEYNAAINDLYLLALQHITDEEYDLLLKEIITI